jgi:hypothetical protein
MLMPNCQTDPPPNIYLLGVQSPSAYWVVVDFSWGALPKFRRGRDADAPHISPRRALDSLEQVAHLVDAGKLESGL